MSDIKRHAKNLGELVLMLVGAVVVITALMALLLWPLSLWWVFNQHLAVAVAITVTWIAAIL